MHKTRCRTSRKRWGGKRSPADSAGRTVWCCGPEEVFRFASPRTGSLELYLNPGSKQKPSNNKHVTFIGPCQIRQRNAEHIWHSYLQLAPESTLKAPYAVHNPGDVLKSQPEVILLSRRLTDQLIPLQYADALFFWKWMVGAMYWLLVWLLLFRRPQTAWFHQNAMGKTWKWHGKFVALKKTFNPLKIYFTYI